jgi:hypothetical protein
MTSWSSPAETSNRNNQRMTTWALGVFLLTFFNAFMLVVTHWCSRGHHELVTVFLYLILVVDFFLLARRAFMRLLLQVYRFHTWEGGQCPNDSVDLFSFMQTVLHYFARCVVIATCVIAWWMILHEAQLLVISLVNVLNIIALGFWMNLKENKVYVQHLIAEQADLVWRLIDQEQAWIFIAGWEIFGYYYKK